MSGRERNKRLRVEQLEVKTLLAGDFVPSGFLAEIQDGDLFITAVDPRPLDPDDLTGAPQSIAFGSPSPGVVEVSPFNDVTISDGMGNEVGVGDSLMLSGFSGSVFVDFASAPREPGEISSFNISIGAIDIPGDLTIFGDNDRLNLNIGENFIGPLSVGGDLSITAATGDISGMIGGETVIAGDLTIEGQEADSSGALLIGDVTAENFSLRLGDGGVFLELAGVQTAEDFVIQTGAGDEDLTIGGVVAGDDIRIDVGDGDNFVLLAESSATDDVRVFSGSGVDEIGVAEVATVNDLQVTSGDSDDEVLFQGLAVGDDLLIDSEGGNDFVEAQNSSVGGDLVAALGAGDDTFVFEESVEGVGDDVFVFGGSGDDEIGILETAVGDSVLIRAGSGNNTVVVGDTAIGGSVFIRTRGGADDVEVQLVTIAHSLYIATGGGGDAVSLLDSEVDFAFVRLGRGDDELTIGGLDIDHFGLFSGGPGDDLLTNFGENDFSDAFGVFAIAFESFDQPAA